MSESLMKIVIVDDNFYSLYLNYKDDAVRLRNESGEVLLIFTGNCYVKKPDSNKYYAHCGIMDKRWVWTFHKTKRNVVTSHENDIYSGEATISEMFLKGELKEEFED